jgi:hypothetical protein
VSPEDHGRYYFEEANFSNLEWLVSGERGLSQDGEYTLRELFLRFQRSPVKTVPNTVTTKSSTVSTCTLVQ